MNGYPLQKKTWTLIFLKLILFIIVPGKMFQLFFVVARSQNPMAIINREKRRFLIVKLIFSIFVYP